jgi:hypothetical protein
MDSIKKNVVLFEKKNIFNVYYYYHYYNESRSKTRTHTIKADKFIRVLAYICGKICGFKHLCTFPST